MTRKITMSATPIAEPKNEQQSVIQFLMLENVSSSEIYTRMCVVYCAQNVITKWTNGYQWVQRYKAEQRSTSDEPWSGRILKRTLHSMPQEPTNSPSNMKNASLCKAIMPKSTL